MTVALLLAIKPRISASFTSNRASAAAIAQSRATFALLLSLLPATASLIGILVLRQMPTAAEMLGVGLVVSGVALHRSEG